MGDLQSTVAGVSIGSRISTVQAGLALQLRVGRAQLTCVVAAAAAAAAAVGPALVSVAVASGGIVVCRRQQNVSAHQLTIINEAISRLQKLILDFVQRVHETLPIVGQAGQSHLGHTGKKLRERKGKPNGT